MKMKLVICTVDENYASRFVDYFNVHYGDKVELSQFTDVNILAQYIKSEKSDVCLIDEEMLQEIDEDMLHGVICVVLSDDRDTAYENISCIYKYQKATLIYKEILNYYADQKKVTRNYIANSADSAKTYAFCSSSGGAGATTVALAYAMRLAKDKKVLYLGLQQYSNYDLVLRGEGNGTFDDVIFALNSKRGDLRLKLESLVRSSRERVDYFKSCDNPWDLQELTAEEIKRLLHELVNSGMYDVVIVDIDSKLGDVEINVLNSVEHIVVVEEGNENSAMKFEKFCTLLDVIKNRNDIDLLCKLGIFYNKFSNKSGSDITDRKIPVCGGVARFEGVQMPGIVSRMAGMDCFNDMIKNDFNN